VIELDFMPRNCVLLKNIKAAWGPIDFIPIKEWEIFSRTLFRAFFSSVVSWALAKHTCGWLRNKVILLGLDFMPLDQIGFMSFNGLRRLFATIDKTQTSTQMHELSVALDLEYQVSSIRAPTLSFH
jgi:hypothetical protein